MCLHFTDTHALKISFPDLKHKYNLENYNWVNLEFLIRLVGAKEEEKWSNTTS